MSCFLFFFFFLLPSVSFIFSVFFLFVFVVHQAQGAFFFFFSVFRCFVFFFFLRLLLCLLMRCHCSPVCRSLPPQPLQSPVTTHPLSLHSVLTFHMKGSHSLLVITHTCHHTPLPSPHLSLCLPAGATPATSISLPSVHLSFINTSPHIYLYFWSITVLFRCIISSVGTCYHPALHTLHVTVPPRPHQYVSHQHCPYHLHWSPRPSGSILLYIPVKHHLASLSRNPLSLASALSSASPTDHLTGLPLHLSGPAGGSMTFVSILCRCTLSPESPLSRPPPSRH